MKIRYINYISLSNKFVKDYIFIILIICIEWINLKKEDNFLPMEMQIFKKQNFLAKRQNSFQW